MARRNRNEGAPEIFAALPWQASVVAGAILFAAMYWALPAYLSDRPHLEGLAGVVRSLAWLPVSVFALTALLSYLRRLPEAANPPKPKVQHDWKDFANEPLFEETTTQRGAEWILTAGRLAEGTRAEKMRDAWSLDGLRALEWKRFELVCARYYELVGFQSQTFLAGADGGVDIKLFKVDPAKPIAIVQCKSWNSSDVGVKEIRELLGDMTSEKVARGIFITTGGYTSDAVTFAAANPIQLLNGEAFLKKISELPSDKQKQLLKFAFEGDYNTPTCASCGIKMVKRESKQGNFWGCIHYPRCRSKFHIRKQAA